MLTEIEKLVAKDRLDDWYLWADDCPDPIQRVNFRGQLNALENDLNSKDGSFDMLYDAEQRLLQFPAYVEWAKVFVAHKRLARGFAASISDAFVLNPPQRITGQVIADAINHQNAEIKKILENDEKSHTE